MEDCCNGLDLLIPVGKVWKLLRNGEAQEPGADDVIVGSVGVVRAGETECGSD